ncbi:MAG TPA: DUF302 domain-containing protein [Afifellaceae bacterium]|nr:DUF302 domain-containing protein [Afifellaceae bacterium]
MKMPAIAILTLVLSTAAAGADDGLVKKLSAHSVQTTMNSLENLVRNKGLTVFARIDHAAGATAVGEDMLPTELLLFGNPAIGTKLMTSQRTVGIDLPIKVLIWEEPDGKVWIAYNDPAYLAERHGIDDRDAVLEKMAAAVRGIVSAAASP